MAKKTAQVQTQSSLTDVKDIDYDSLWKVMITSFSYQFIRRFLPDMYPYIDLNYPIEYLEQEFPSSLRPKKKGRKITDKLLKVRLKSGEEHYVLTHIEVQATGESTYSKKMYLYNSVIYLQRDMDITALVIYTTEHYPTNHNHYKRECFGTEVSFKFNSFLISKQDERKLLKSNDLFDLAILACLYIIRTRNDMVKRLFYKKKLHRLAEEKNFSSLEMEKILIFVEEILQLPEPLELKFEKHIEFKEKKLKDMEMTQNSKRMFAAMFKGMYGESVESMKRKQTEAERQAEHAERQAEHAERQAEHAERQAEHAERRAALQAEQAALQAEQMRLEKEKLQTQLILLLYLQSHLTVEKIAKDYEIELETVQKVIDKYLDGK